MHAFLHASLRTSGPLDRRLPAGLAPLALVLVLALTGCGEVDAPDAYGNFEAEEVVVSAEVGGRLLHYAAREGTRLDAGAIVAHVDTVPLILQRAQIVAQRAAIAARREEGERQLAALEAQTQIAERQRARTERLAAQGAATATQQDQTEREARVGAAQRDAARAALQRLDAEAAAVDAQVAAIDDQVRRAAVRNPVAGTVLVELARAGEHVAPGQPLYRIAPLDTLTLRAWVTASQLADVAVGRAVTVHVDGPDGTLRAYPGIVRWIADRAEFTPTPVQTRDERAELVYAVKVRVPNGDGLLRIGMPADVSFGGDAR